MLVRCAIFLLLFFFPCQGLFISGCAAQPNLSNARNSFIAVRKRADYVFPGQTAEKAIRKSSVVIVKRIKRADYEGDRAALKQLYADLAPFGDDKKIGANVHYWRGFAMWRRAFNGTTASSEELEEDLTSAAKEFERAIQKDPDFVDAKIGAASCWQNIAALYYVGKDLPHAREYMESSFPLLKEAEAAQPNNPRLLWVLGAYRFYNPPERGGGQAFAIETYEKGLRAARQQASRTHDILKPSWGEPELLMSLAFSNLNRTNPDLTAAEQQAEHALTLVPYWHYVRDLLLPQIRDAKKTRDDLYRKKLIISGRLDSHAGCIRNASDCRLV